MNKEALKKLDLASASELLAKKEISATELCGAYLDRKNEVDGNVKAFLNIDRDDILKQAAESDKRRAEGKGLSPYDGIPIAIKDCISVSGQPCTCASKILENFKSPYDSTVVKRLKEKGLVIFGRTNMDEFAMGSSCENSAYQKTANPWDFSCVPGGSSGGSAACVAASEVPVSLGSDTGGSIRQPAAFCGVTGLKPTYGRVSRYGLVAFASSLDQIGPIGHSVLDTAAILDIIGGHDPLDSTSLPEKSEGFADIVRKSSGGNLKGVKIGIPKEYFNVDAIEPGVKAVMQESIKTLQSLGAETIEISLPHTEYAIAVYYIIATAEASANLARFDGIRYGVRPPEASDLNSLYFKTRGHGFGNEVKRRIILGTYVLSSGYYDAYYLRGQKVRTLIRNDFMNAFEKCNVILAPATPSAAFRFGEKSDPLQMYLADIFTIAVNLAGTCAISLPAGLDKSMPVGMQFIAPPMGEHKMLSVSRIFEENRGIKEFIPSL